MSTSEQLRALLAPPSDEEAQRAALALFASLPSTSQHASHLGTTLQTLLEDEQTRLIELDAQLQSSQETVAALLRDTRDQVEEVLHRSTQLQVAHEHLTDNLIDQREALESTLSSRQSGGGTLRERLEDLGKRREQTEKAQDWINVLAQAERLGLEVLLALQSYNLQSAFGAYVAVVDYVTSIHAACPGLALVEHLVAMTASVWRALVKSLTATMVEKLANIGWPKPIAEPLDWEEEGPLGIRIAFVDLLLLERLNDEHPLPGQKKEDGDAPPLLAIAPLLHHLMLRFRWQFEGTRNTNRIDKPEYPLSHVLNLLTAHERFLEEDIQDLLDANGYSHIDALTEFTTLLLPPLQSRLERHTPQLLDLPPILAHTVYQALDFDAALRQRGYRPRGHHGEWNGLVDSILGRNEWYEKWLEGEKQFFDDKYYAAISDAEAWQIIPVDDFDAAASSTGVRPTNSALRVAELSEQLTDRYRPLPTKYALPFLLRLHLPLLNTYASRITSAIQAFESLSNSFIPGALGDSRAATSGLGGAQRLVRAGVSARWMSEKCETWGEDAVSLALFAALQNGASDDEQAKRLLEESEETVFDGERKIFVALAERAEELAVRQIGRAHV